MCTCMQFLPHFLVYYQTPLFTKWYTGLGSALLRHLVHDRFLLSSSIFTQCLLNDSAEEHRLCSAISKALLYYTQNQHHFYYNISLAQSNLWKRQTPLSQSDRCMLSPWTPHQGPDKSRSNNNLWVEVLQWSSDQTVFCLPDVSSCAHIQCFFSKTESKAAESMKMLMCSILEKNLKSTLKPHSKQWGKLWLIICPPNRVLGN